MAERQIRPSRGFGVPPADEDDSSNEVTLPRVQGNTPDPEAAIKIATSAKLIETKSIKRLADALHKTEQSSSDDRVKQRFNLRLTESEHEMLSTVSKSLDRSLHWTLMHLLRPVLKKAYDETKQE